MRTHPKQKGLAIVKQTTHSVWFESIPLAWFEQQTSRLMASPLALVLYRATQETDFVAFACAYKRLTQLARRNDHEEKL